MLVNVLNVRFKINYIQIYYTSTLTALLITIPGIYSQLILIKKINKKNKEC
jgi:hypothetical protein